MPESPGQTASAQTPTLQLFPAEQLSPAEQPIRTVRMPTAQQMEILASIGKNTTVSAGAGTGKTGVMVDRFLKILEQSRLGTDDGAPPVRVGEILTITFTDDAATELKRRLVEKLSDPEILKLLVTDTSDPEEMLRDRREVETAYISTIHGFCRRILKENPFEAGLDPEFAVLTGAENAILLESAFEQIVDEGFRDGLPEVTGLFTAFSTARRYGDSSSDPVNMLRRESTLLLERLRSRGRSLAALQEWVDGGPEPIRAASLALIAACVNQISSAVADGIGEMQPLRVGVPCGIEEARIALLGRLEWLGPILDPDQELEGRCQDLLEIRKLLGKTTTRKGADPEAAEQLKALFRALASLIDENKKLLGSFDAAFETESALQTYRLLALAARLWRRHEELKRKEGKLDFNDLQLLARDLLRDCPGVLARYRRRLRHVMVDEFQDTDDLQYDIVKLLHGERNLFCVGDPKQSIYGFRNADVTIFGKLIEATQQASDSESVHLPLT
ncbi:MAG: UvrD-helicase domain-containing protein, partial [Chloroflexi bacterium]|nr:UvrD-helicase domain-containing protein [Chloroflexota bacterium]